MEIFSALLPIGVGNSPVTGEFPAHKQRPVTQSFGVFFDLLLNKRLNKQSWGWWFETPSHSLWHHYNGQSTLVEEMSHWCFRTISVKKFNVNKKFDTLGLLFQTLSRIISFLFPCSIKIRAFWYKLDFDAIGPQNQMIVLCVICVFLLFFL